MKKEKRKIGAEKSGKQDAKNRSFRSLLAFTIVLAAIFAGVRLYRGTTPPAQVKFVENEKAENSALEKRKDVTKPAELFGGEVYLTTERLRASGAAGMAVSLGAFASASKYGSFPADLTDVWRFVETHQLLPPGVTVVAGELRSENTRFHVRYRREPFGIEVIAEPLPAGNNEPLVIVRLPLPTADGRTLIYYQSSSTASRSVPPPFEAASNLVAAGWRSEQWRGELLPNNGEFVTRLEDERRALAGFSLNKEND